MIDSRCFDSTKLKLTPFYTNKSALNDVYETLNAKTENKLQYFCYDSVEREEAYVYENNSSSTGQAYEYKNLNNLLREMSIRAPQERINETTLNGKRNWKSVRTFEAY